MLFSICCGITRRPKDPSHPISRLNILGLYKSSCSTSARRLPTSYQFCLYLGDGVVYSNKQLFSSDNCKDRFADLFCTKSTVPNLLLRSNGVVLGGLMERNCHLTVFPRLSHFHSREIISKDLRRRRPCSNSMGYVLR